jgi:hypothetical protein
LKIPLVNRHPGLVLRIAFSTLSTSGVSARASCVTTTTMPRAITTIERVTKEFRIVLILDTAQRKCTTEILTEGAQLAKHQ